MSKLLPFEVKSRTGAIELFDGFGSYVCEYGHVHDYSKLDLDDLGDIVGPFASMDELTRSLDDEI